MRRRYAATSAWQESRPLLNAACICEMVVSSTRNCAPAVAAFAPRSAAKIRNLMHKNMRLYWYCAPKSAYRRIELLHAKNAKVREKRGRLDDSTTAFLSEHTFCRSPF